MKSVNLEAMLDYSCDDEYEYKDHKWFNQTQPCGCIVALCLDIEPNQEESNFIASRFTKISSLQSFIRETLTSNDEEMRKKTDEFQNELANVQIELQQFIGKKRKEYNFPIVMDCNSEYYFIKLKNGPTCR